LPDIATATGEFVASDATVTEPDAATAAVGVKVTLT
jgi:hypothetical protein